MTKKTTLRNSLKFATSLADWLYLTQLSALNVNLYADDAHKQRLLSTLGLVTAVRDQLNCSIPSLDYLRRQCSTPTPGNRSRVIETLKAGKGIPDVLRGFFQDLPSFVQVDTAEHETALSAAPKLSALPELLNQAKQIAESGGDLKLIKELLD